MEGEHKGVRRLTKVARGLVEAVRPTAERAGRVVIGVERSRAGESELEETCDREEGDSDGVSEHDGLLSSALQRCKQRPRP